MAILLSGAAAAQIDGSKEPLCRAAQLGDLVQVRTLLAGGANPNVRDEQGQTPLMRAAAVLGRAAVLEDAKGIQQDYQGVAKLLLDKGADVNARDPAGRTALLMALDGAASEYKVIGGDEGMARLLISRGAAVNAQDDMGWSPLLNVLHLWADQPAMIAFLIAKGADVNARLKDGRTGLMLAARLGKDDRLPVLLAKGANVNASDNTGTTALMVAAAVQWDEQALTMMKLLLAKGADPNAKDNQGRTAAGRVAQDGYIERAKFLADHGTRVADPATFLASARNFALARAIAQGSIETAKAMLEQGADPNFHEIDGRTLLMIAADNEYSAAKALLLLSHGASVNLAGSNKDTALMVAADQYQAETVKALLDRGADPNAADRQGNTVLMRAAASKRTYEEERHPLIHLLLAAGADPRHKNSRGVTALMLMAGDGNPALPLLLEKQVEVDARDAEGNTALHYAARHFARGWQRRDGWALLQKGADVNAANQLGETALILAATQYEPDAAQLLLVKGANVNAKTKRGRTALMQAIDGPKDFDNDKHLVYSPRIAELLIATGADVNAHDAEGKSAMMLATERGYAEMVAALKKAGAKE
ncbi:MAG TPA: ankyrin repeat domain-containing protein [Bryobacteraceae bacterium]|nr:ankyrin repeat domain-containing protein [Bryobacteraceae bacterium]